MSEFLTFAFVGGDRRQINVILGFATEGYKVNVFGIDADELKEAKNVELFSDVGMAVKDADVVVLPLPYSSIIDGEMINAPLSNDKIATGELFRILSEYNRKLVLAGKVDERLAALSKIYGLHIIDYMDRDELAILNAIPTAEGAIKIAMEELPITIHESNCLCIGFGRVGKILTKTLDGLGANVTVAVRKKRDMAYIKAFGYNWASTEEPLKNVEKYDVIFNTVPAIMINGKILREVRDDCLIIDLASKPGGVDFDTAKRLGRNVIWALSLPGKTAPITAGKIICDTIKNILEELGVK